MSDYIPHSIRWMVGPTGVSFPVVESLIDPPPFIGELTIIVKRGKQFYNNPKSPLCELKIGNDKKRTTVGINHEAEFQWDQPFNFTLTGKEEHLRLKVFNKTVFGLSEIGLARLPLEALLSLHAAVTDQQISSTSFNEDSHTFFADIGRDTKQAIPAGHVSLTVRFNWKNPDDAALFAASCRRENIKFPGPQNQLPHWKEQSTEGIINNKSENKEQVTISSSQQQQQQQNTHGTHIPPSTPHSQKVSQQSQEQKHPQQYYQQLPHPMPAAHNHPAYATPPPIPGSAGPPSLAHSRQSSLAGTKLRLFGGPLSNGMSRSKSCVPVVVYVCIQYLIYHGLHTVGLFRVSGSSVVVENIKAAFESGDSVNISDPHATAAVLKSYFRELSDSLIPSAAFQQFITVTDIRGRPECFRRLKELIDNLLPLDNRTVLSFLLHFLTLVATKERENKMSIRNLATVWGPNLLRSVQGDQIAPDAQTLAQEMVKRQNSQEY